MLNNLDVAFIKVNDTETLQDIIEILSLQRNIKQHLTEEQFYNILQLYFFHSQDKTKNQKIQYHMKAYKETIRRYPTISDWQGAQSHEKLFNFGKRTNFLYYYTMVLNNRLELDWVALNARTNLPRILKKSQLDTINLITQKLNYSECVCKRVISFISKIIIASGKKFREINEEDIYLYRNVSSTTINSSPKPCFHVLQHLGNIDPYLKYTKNIRVKEKGELPATDHIKNVLFAKAYNDYSVKIDKRFSSEITKQKKRSAAKALIQWLEEEHPNLNHLNELTFDHLKQYTEKIKKGESDVTGERFSKRTVVSYLSSLKPFLGYLKKVNLLNEGCATRLINYNAFYFGYNRTKFLHDPISIEERVKIEKAIYSYNYSNFRHPLAESMIKLLYLLGVRLMELVSLKWDCIKGTKELPILHVHKAKNYKERYIPLLKEEYELIRNAQIYNANSNPIYSKHDGEFLKRLFSFRQEVILEDTLNGWFQKLLFEEGVVNDLKQKDIYTTKTLRKIRITTWLENGLAPDEVAYLAGHSNVDSHNDYIIGKETRIKNAYKVYNEFYKGFVEQVEAGRWSEDTVEQIDIEGELKRLEDEILEIEQKTINQENIITISKYYPELVFPVTCGSCFAQGIFGNDFTCKRMELPCLDCEKFTTTKDSKHQFDDYVTRIYKSRVEHKKSGLNGLVDRDDKLIARLKNFYVNQLNIDRDEVDKNFINLEKKVLPPKRGRPPKHS